MIVALFLELSLVLSRIVIRELVEKLAFSVRKKNRPLFANFEFTLLRCFTQIYFDQLVKNKEEKGKIKSIVTISLLRILN